MNPSRLSQWSIRKPVSTVALAAMVFAQSAAAFDIADSPLFIPTSTEPNVVLTLDDSSSMRRAFVPESLDDSSSTRHTRSAKSSHRNALYYDPATVYPPPVFVKADGTLETLSTSFERAWVNGYADGGAGRPSTRGDVDLSKEYRPTWEYDPAVSNNGDPDVGQVFGNHPDFQADLQAIGVWVSATDKGRGRGGKAYYYVWSPTNSDCTTTDIADDDCYSLKIVGNQPGPADVDNNGVIDANDEKQNFANWYSFYRTRNLMTVAGASRAMVGVRETARVSWQSLKTGGAGSGTCFIDFQNLASYRCEGWTGNALNVDNRIREFGATHRHNLYRWLVRLPAPSSTPNRFTPLRSATMRAGRYFATAGVNSPYATKPQVTQVGLELSCRPNFHILMTDGYWNRNDDSDTTSSPPFCTDPADTTLPLQALACGNADNARRTLPIPHGETAGKVYDPALRDTWIYSDANSHSLADVAFHYWATDLRPDLNNNLLPYYADRNGTEDKQFWNPKNDPASWQHMTTFTVGLGMTSSLDLTNPDRRWAGSTYGDPAYTNFSNDSNNNAWPLVGGWSTWAAGSQSPSQEQARVYDLWHAAINSRGQAFSAETPGQLTEALQSALNRILERDAAAAALATNSTRLSTNSLLFQAKFTAGIWTGGLTAHVINTDGSLGAVKWNASVPTASQRRIYTWSGEGGIEFTEAALSSANLWSSIGSPALLNYLRGDDADEMKNGGPYRTRDSSIGDIVNSDPAFVHAQNYGYRSLPEGGYDSFLVSKQARRKMIYIGSNDGFLRGFDVEDGREVFAYVPNAVIPNLALLKEPNYTHRYFVDGSSTAWDAHFGGGWKTVLVGTTGAGGKSIFALDVTDPDSFSAQKVLWEINDKTEQRSQEANPEYATRLGHTMGQAVVAKLNNNKWAAIFGNGYRSSSEQASLYIVNVSDGRLIRRIDTGIGANSPVTMRNGLGTPTLHDVNGDDVYDVVYAPDMLGNVWKFDLSASDPDSWSIAYPRVSDSVYPKGTPLFQARDAAGNGQPISARVELAAPPQGKGGIMVLFGTGRFFAKHDDEPDGRTQSFYGIWDNGARVEATDRSGLVKLNIAEASGRREVTKNNPAEWPIDWSTKRGWYMDFLSASPSERVIGTAVVRGGRVIFTTLLPSPDPCEFGGSGWLMEVNATTGDRLPYAVFDTTADGKINEDDAQSASGVRINVGMVKAPLVVEGSPTAAKFLSGTTGELQVVRNRTFGKPLGRESWREVQR